MIITKPGVDVISVDEQNISDLKLDKNNKIHIIKLNFKVVDDEKMDWLIKNFPLTNRFIINDNIRYYNSYFKSNNKKYYVENNYNTDIISFFKKNNKVLLNFDKLGYDVNKFVLKRDVFKDVLKNLEIIQINNSIFEAKRDILLGWNGNVIIDDGKNW